MRKSNGKLETWKARRREFEASGLTRRAYCQRNGIKVSTLDYWFSRLRKGQRTRGLVEIGCIATQSVKAMIVVQVGKFRVEINDPAAMQILAETVKTLGSLA